MFKRRVPRTFLQNTRELLWPSMGWIRAAKYNKHRLVRLSDTVHKIALGLALGVAISFSPLVGTHFIQVSILAYFFRANILAALMGTFAGNPLTFPFIWWGGLAFGTFLFEALGFHTSSAMPDNMSIHAISHLFKTRFFETFMPWMLGGYLLGIISIPISYAIFFRMIRSAKKARHRARVSAIRRAAREVTGQDK